MKQLKRILTGLAAAAALAGLTNNVYAVDFHVATAQDLQNALTSSAADGADDNIYLAAGYYTGNFNFNSAENYSLTIQGEPGTTNTAITIDGAGTGTDLNLANTGVGNFTVRGITFVAGALSIGGGSASTVLVDTCRLLNGGNLGVSGQYVTVTNSVVNGFSANGGNAMQISGASVTIGGCAVFSNNACSIYIPNCTVANLIGNSIVANSGYVGHTDCTGNYLGGSSLCIACASTINFYNNNVARNNSTITFPGSASDYIIGNVFQNNGGSVVAGGTVVFSNNIVANNNSGLNGDGSGVIANNAFTGNSGAALSWNSGYINGGYVASTCYVFGNTFTGNQGGAFASSAYATITNNVFTGNSVANGGALNLSQNATVSGNSFTGNSASSEGGAIYASGGSYTISGNKIKSNSASSGGGLYVNTASSLVLVDNLVSQNKTGGAIYVHPTSSFTMINNTVSDNATTGNGGGLSIAVSGTSEILNVYNNIIWGNSASGNGSDVYLAGTGSKKSFINNDADGMYGVWDITANLVDVAPAYFDPVNGDYHLRATSACINAGTNGAPSIPPYDLDGNNRTNAAIVDLGCYEFNNTNFHPADTNQNWQITAAEYANYAAAWKNSQSWPTGPSQVPADYLTRAGYIQNVSTNYHNDGAGAPLSWKPGSN